MWRKRDEDREAKAKATRLASVLGVELDEDDTQKGKPEQKGSETSQTRTATSVSSLTEAEGKNARPLEERSHNAGKTSGRGAARRGEKDVQAHAPGAGAPSVSNDVPRTTPHRSFTGGQDSPANEVYAALDAALTNFAWKSDEAAEKKLKLFEENLLKTAGKIVAQVQTSLLSTLSPLEHFSSEADQMKSAFDASLDNFAKNTEEAARAQAVVFEETLGKISRQLVSEAQQGLEALSSRAKGSSGHPEEMTAAIEAALGRFAQETQVAAEAQAKLFEEKLTKVSQLIASQAQRGLDSASNREESSQAQMEALNSALESAFTRFTQQTREAAHAQAKVFEETLGVVSRQIVSQTQAGLESASNRAKSSEAQVQSANSALESALARFIQKTEEATQARAPRFEESLIKISEQVVARTQKAFETLPTRVKGQPVQTGDVSLALEKALKQFHQETQSAVQEQAEAFEKHLAKVVEQVASRTREGLEAATQEGSRAHVEGLNSALEATLTRFGQQTQEMGRAQSEAFERALARNFEENLAKLSAQIAAQAQTQLEAASSRAQNAELQAQQINSAFEATLTHFAEHARETAQAQEKIFAEGLARTSEQVVARAQQGFEAITKRADVTRAQAEETSSALQAALTRFTQETREAAGDHAKAFEENLAKAAEQVMVRTREGLETAVKEGGRAQLEGLNSALEAALVHFRQDTQESAKAQSGVFEESLATILEQNLTKFSEQIVSRTQASLETISSGIEGTRAQAEEMNSELRSTLSRFGQETQHAADTHATVFEEKLSRIAEQVVAKTQAGLEVISTRVEGTRAQAEEMNSELRSTLSRLSQETQHAADTHATVFEEKLSRIAEQVVAKTQAGMDAISSRVEGTRAQAEEMNSALQTTLARVSQETQQAAQAQTAVFEERLARVLEENLSKAQQQIVSETQAGLETVSNRLEVTRGQAEQMSSVFEKMLAGFNQESQQAAAAHAKSFEENLRRIAEQVVDRTRDGLEAFSSRVEGSHARAEEISSHLEATMTRFGEETRQAAQAQVKSFEDNLAQVSAQLVSRTQQGLEAVSNRVEDTRARAVEMNLALEATLARFTKETQESAQAQAKVFEENLARTGEQVVARTQTGLESIPQRVEDFRAQAQQMNTALDAAMNRFAQRVEAFRTQAQEMNSALSTTMTRLAQKTEGCRAQAEELNSALGSSLTRFAQRTADVSQTQVKAFEEKLTKVGEQLISRMQSRLEVLSNRVEGCRIQAEQIDTALEGSLTRYKQSQGGAPEPPQAQPRFLTPQVQPKSAHVPNRLARNALLGLAALAIICLVTAVATVVIEGVGRPRLYEITSGYRGWVLVKYQDASCPPLASSGLYSVVTVPPSGRACTSSPTPAGWQYRKSESVNGDGSRSELQDLGWDKGSQIRFLGNSNDGGYELFFVGTNDELSQSWGSKPKPSDALSGSTQAESTPKAHASKSRHSSN
jgi:hypothetical protein